MALKDMFEGRDVDLDLPELVAAIEAALDCAAHCSACADACLDEDGDMRRCIRLDLDCAEICKTTATILSRPGPSGDAWRSMLEACRDACRECAEECEKHDHDHCRACAEACRRCEKACSDLLAAVS